MSRTSVLRPTRAFYTIGQVLDLLLLAQCSIYWQFLLLAGRSISSGRPSTAPLDAHGRSHGHRRPPGPSTAPCPGGAPAPAIDGRTRHRHRIGPRATASVTGPDTATVDGQRATCHLPAKQRPGPRTMQHFGHYSLSDTSGPRRKHLGSGQIRASGSGPRTRATHIPPLSTIATHERMSLTGPGSVSGCYATGATPQSPLGALGKAPQRHLYCR